MNSIDTKASRLERALLVLPAERQQMFFDSVIPLLRRYDTGELTEEGVAAELGAEIARRHAAALAGATIAPRPLH